MKTSTILQFLHRRKYEVLLLALVQHLFIGIFLRDLPYYTKYIWPINMLVLGLASVGVFIEKGLWKNTVRNVLFLVVLALPLALPFVGESPNFMLGLSLSYVLFFVFIFWEVLKFLLRPGYVNIDIISASACGYFLLLEISDVSTKPSSGCNNPHINANSHHTLHALFLFLFQKRNFLSDVSIKAPHAIPFTKSSSVTVANNSSKNLTTNM